MNINFKKIIFIIVLQCISVFLHAQVSKVPDGILFQAIAKDPSGNPAKGRTIYIKNAIRYSLCYFYFFYKTLKMLLAAV